MIVSHDGAHDFDFLIGDWKAHVRRLPDRLVGSTTWVTYDGISNHKKVLGSNANFEEFEVDSPESHLHIRAQTLRLYNADSRQWQIYLVDVDKGTIDLPPVAGQFTGKRGEFFNQQEWKRAYDPRALRVARSVADVGADGAVVLRRRGQVVGGQLDLRAIAVAHGHASGTATGPPVR